MLETRLVRDGVKACVKGTEENEGGKENLPESDRAIWTHTGDPYALEAACEGEDKVAS